MPVYAYELLQALLQCTAFSKTLSLCYVSTSRRELPALISIAFSFVLYHSFLIRTALRTVEDLYPSRSVRFTCVRCFVWVQLLWKANLPSPRRSHCSRRGYSSVGPCWRCWRSWTMLEMLEKYDCHSRSSLGTSLGGTSPRLPSACSGPQAAKCGEEQEHRRLSPDGGFPTLLRSSAPCCCVLPSLGTFSQPLLWGTSKVGHKTRALSYIRKIKSGDSLSAQTQTPSPS